MKNKVLKFDISKKYLKPEEVSQKDCIHQDGVFIPLYTSVYSDKYNNLIGKTASGNEVLIERHD